MGNKERMRERLVHCLLAIHTAGALVARGGLDRSFAWWWRLWSAWAAVMQAWDLLEPLDGWDALTVLRDVQRHMPRRGAPPMSRVEALAHLAGASGYLRAMADDLPRERQGEARAVVDAWEALLRGGLLEPAGEPCAWCGSVHRQEPVPEWKPDAYRYKGRHGPWLEVTLLVADLPGGRAWRTMTGAARHDAPRSAVFEALRGLGFVLADSDVVEPHPGADAS